MLKDRMKQHIAEVIKVKEEQQALQGENKVELAMYKEEMNYVKKYDLLSDDIKENIILVEENPISRFSDAYIERVHKESEEVIAKETPASFLTQPIQFLKQHKNEFIYLESHSFEMVKADAVSVELDDIFGFYNVMLGLKLQKKLETTLKTYLSNNLHGDELKFGLMFNQGDGLWDLNFALNYVEGFKEDMSIGEAYSLIYRFLFKLVEAAEEEQ
ncbi:branched-chain amino acid aminotransferase [Bacillus songklensis]|uniref:Branched-chain amino acid aminotransferase n=1 Tax=Bacillus songklensis TaxID=1069116 RepID=A0ABV8B820_9BACI